MLNAGRLTVTWQVAASAAVHALLLIVLLRGVDSRVEAPRERSIAVDIITAAQYAAAIAAPPQVRALAPPEPLARLPAATPAPVAPVISPAAEANPPAMVHATHLQAAEVLAEPASKEVLDTLPLLASQERVAQMCNIEALAQIQTADARFDPDILVAYAMADMQVANRVVDADGGAFRSKREWYAFKFHCEVAADLKSVTDFSFAIGEPIPRDEWESHDLTAEDADLD
jgi:hypothetical protein